MDMHDTLYLDAPPVAGEQGGRLLLRTHTSPVQIRTMLRVTAADPRGHARAWSTATTPSTPRTRRPSRRSKGSRSTRASPSSTSRRRSPTSPTGSSRRRRKVRFRPSFFPFTEPSAEMDVECQLCHGQRLPGVQGHRLDRDPRLRHGASRRARERGLDSERYTGWAFGMGPDRIAHAALRHSRHPPAATTATCGSWSSSWRGADSERLPSAGSRRSSRRAARRRRERASTGSPCSARRSMRVEPLHADLADIVVGAGRGGAAASQRRPAPALHGGRRQRPSGCNVVCGAPNVDGRAKYPFAPVGATLPGGLRIEKRKIRGEPSKGCSAPRASWAWARSTTASSSSTPTPRRARRLLDGAAVDDDAARRRRQPQPARPARPQGRRARAGRRYGVAVPAARIPGARSVDVAAGAAGRRRAADVGGVRDRHRGRRGCRRFHRRRHPRREGRARRPTGCARRLEAVGVALDQQRRGRDQLRDARARPADARVRPRAGSRRRRRRAARRGRARRWSRSTAWSASSPPEMTVIADGERRRSASPASWAARHRGRPTRPPTSSSSAPSSSLADPAHPARARLSAPTRATGSSGASTAGAASRRCGAASSSSCATAGGELVATPVDLLARAGASAADLPPPGPGGPGAGRRAAAAVAGAATWSPSAPPWSPSRTTAASRSRCPAGGPTCTREIDLIEEVARLHGYEKFPSELRPFRAGTLPDAPSRRPRPRCAAGWSRQGFFEVVTAPDGPGRWPDSVGCSTRCRPTTASSGAGSCPGWCGWSRRNWANHVARRPPVRDRHRLRAPRPGRAAAGRAARGRGPDRAARAAALDRHGRRRGFDLWDLKGQFEAAVALAIPGGRGAG